MEQFTTYRAKGIQIGLVFIFKYDLNGNLKLFEIDEGELNSNQIKWLFTGYLPKGTTCDNSKDFLSELKENFPADENAMKNIWMKEEKYINHFSVEIFPADISFDAMWVLFDNKVSKMDAIKAYNKLKKGDIVKCFIEIPYYLRYLEKNPHIAKLHLSTYINKRRFEDERQIVVGKVFNSVLHNLAKKKTER